MQNSEEIIREVFRQNSNGI